MAEVCAPNVDEKNVQRLFSLPLHMHYIPALSGCDTSSRVYERTAYCTTYCLSYHRRQTNHIVIPGEGVKRLRKL